MKNLILLLGSLFIFSFLQAQYFGKDDTTKIYRTGSTITFDGKGLEKCWDSTQWIPIKYVWEKNGTITTAADIQTTNALINIDSSDFAASFKMLWSSKTNMLYLLVKVTDNVLISNYDWVGGKSNYTKFDDLEIFYQDDDVCRSVWPGCDHTFTHKAKAIHLTSNGYGVDMGGPSWGSFVLYNKSMKMKLDKSAAPNYTWEVGMKLVNNKVIDSQLQDTNCIYTKPLPDSLITTLSLGKVFGFTLNYIDTDVSGQNREAFVSNIYLPDGNDPSGNKIRNASWQNSGVYGTAKLMGYSTQVYDTTPIDTTPKPKTIKTSGSSIDIFPNPTKENIWVVMDNDGSGSVTVKVMNMLGSVVAEKVIQKPAGAIKEEIALAGLPSGLYIVDVSSDGGHVVKRVQKQ